VPTRPCAMHGKGFKRVQDNGRDADLDRQLNTWVSSRSGAELSPEIERRVRDTLTPLLTPVKPLPCRAVLTLEFLGVFAVFAAGLIGIMDKAGIRLMTGHQMVSIAAILIVGGILLSLTLAWRMVPGSGQGFPVSLAVAVSGCGVIGGFALLFPWRASGAFVAEGWPCAATEIIIAVPAVIIVGLFARRGALFMDTALGAIMSGLAVIFALTVLQFQCMFQQAPHLLVWHGVTATALVGLGAMIGWLQRHRWIS
jgi:hypothetical protein